MGSSFSKCCRWMGKTVAWKRICDKQKTTWSSSFCSYAWEHSLSIGVCATHFNEISPWELYSFSNVWQKHTCYPTFCLELPPVQDSNFATAQWKWQGNDLFILRKLFHFKMASLFLSIIFKWRIAS